MIALMSNPCAAQNIASEEDLNRATRSVAHKHYKTAYRRFRKLAQHGCPYSQCIVGIMHQKGIGADKNGTQAVYWFEKSAAQGWKDAEHRLGLMHLNGDGIAKNVKTGAHWLSMAASHGMNEAQDELSKLEAEGKYNVQKVASEGFNEVRQLSEEFPSVPTGQTSEPNAYSQGLENLQKSWTGYVDVVKNLDAASSAAAAKR